MVIFAPEIELREIEFFRCGRLQPMNNHRLLGGFAPHRLARYARPRALRALPTRHPPIRNAPSAHRLARCQAARLPSCTSKPDPHRQNLLNLPKLLSKRASGEDGGQRREVLARGKADYSLCGGRLIPIPRSRQGARAGGRNIIPIRPFPAAPGNHPFCNFLPCTSEDHGPAGPASRLCPARRVAARLVEAGPAPQPTGRPEVTKRFSDTHKRTKMERGPDRRRATRVFSAIAASRSRQRR
jgi:hypothetical protein